MHSQNILYPYYSPLKKVLKVNAKQTNKIIVLAPQSASSPSPPHKTLLFSMFPFLINWGYWSDLGLTCLLIFLIFLAKD